MKRLLLAMVLTPAWALAQTPTTFTGSSSGNNNPLTASALNAAFGSKQDAINSGNAATVRTNLGLGPAATMAVGTGANTVAAGNDSRLAGALQASNNLSDLASAATALANLGGVNASQAAAAAPVRTFMTRTGAIVLLSADVATALGYTPLAPANNLSDISSAAAARVNLGLGTVAVQSAAAVAITGGTESGVTLGANTLAGPLTIGGTVGVAGQAIVSTVTGEAFATIVPATTSILIGSGTLGSAATATIGAGVSLSAGGTLSNTGVLSFNSRTGALTLLAADVTAALGYTPLSNAGGTITGTLNVAGPVVATTVAAGLSASTYNATGTGSVSRSVPAHAVAGHVSLLDYFTNLSGTNAPDGFSCAPIASISASNTTLTTDGSCHFTTTAVVGEAIHGEGFGAASGYGPISAVTIAGTLGPATFADELPYAEVQGTADAYAHGGLGAVLTVQGSLSAPGAVVTSGSGCTNGTFNLTLSPNPIVTINDVVITATPAVVQGTWTAGVLTLNATPVSVGAYTSLVPGYGTGKGATLLGNPGCTVQPSAHMNYVPTNVLVDNGGNNYNVGSPGSIVLTYAGGGSQVTVGWGVTAVTDGTFSYVSTIGTIVNDSTIVLNSAASTTLASGRTELEYGTPIDSALASAILAARSTGGRCILIPAGQNGAAYVQSGSFDIGASCLEGAHNEPEMGGSQPATGSTQAQDVGNASVIMPFDHVHPAYVVGAGGAIHWLNRYVLQYLPNGGVPFVPSMTPYFIVVSDNGGLGNNVLEHINDIDGAYGIAVDCLSISSSCGLKVALEDVELNSFNVGFMSSHASNTAFLHNVHILEEWQQNNLSLRNYREAIGTGTIGALIGRSDNTTISDSEFGYMDRAIVTFPQSVGATFGPWTGGQVIGTALSARVAYEALDPISPASGAGLHFSSVNALSNAVNSGASDTLFKFTQAYVQTTISDMQIYGNLGHEIMAVGNGLPGASVVMNGGQFGSAAGASWGAPSFGHTLANGLFSINGTTFYQNSANVGNPIVNTSAGGTLIWNGSSSPNAQFGNTVSVSSLSNCGSSTAAGTYSHITLTVTSGAPTGCTINLSGSLSAASILSITPHQNASYWAGAGTVTSEVIGSTGLAAGTYDIYGL